MCCLVLIKNRSGSIISAMPIQPSSDIIAPFHLLHLPSACLCQVIRLESFPHHVLCDCTGLKRICALQDETDTAACNADPNSLTKAEGNPDLDLSMAFHTSSAVSKDPSIRLAA